MASNLYTVTENEKVLFELECEGLIAPGVDSGVNELLGGFREKLKNTGAFFCGKQKSLLVITDKRIIGIEFSQDCCSCSEERSFFDVPVKTLSGWNSYRKSRFCCCKSFSFSIGVTRPNNTSTCFSFSVDNITDDHAQALIAQINTLA